LVLLLAALFRVASFASIGLNAGAQFDTSAVKTVSQSGASWVRLNFIVTSQQSGTSDPGFVSMYQSIINAYNSSGIRIYGLIGSEAVKQGYDRNNPSAFVQPFVSAASDIISRWQDKIPVFELFNEPNDYAGGNSAQMTPYWFAKLLQSVYEQKYYQKWSALLISGPLFSFDGTDASDYLYQTYFQGMTTLAWDWFHQNAGTYPLDGIGYHIYTTQGSTDPVTVTNGLVKNLNGIWKNGIVAGESIRASDPNPSKSIWVSEFGWGSNNIGEDGQASNLNVALTVFQGNSHVACSMWFTMRDWSTQGWGLRYANNTGKRSWNTFVSWTGRQN